MPFDGHISHPREAELRDAIAVLERAREIVRTRWTRTWVSYAGTKPPLPPRVAWGFLARRKLQLRHCAAGALVIAVHGEKFLGRVDPSALSMAFTDLRIALHPAAEALTDVAGGGIIGWNDMQPDANAVVAGFDKAIANLQAEIVKGAAYAV